MNFDTEKAEKVRKKVNQTNVFVSSATHVLVMYTENASNFQASVLSTQYSQKNKL